MRISIIIFVLILLVYGLLYPEILANLPELEKPTELRIDGDYIFISDQYSVRIYDFKTFKQIKKLSKKGEGPGEFLQQPRIDFTKKKLVLSDNYKIILFSKSFQYLREIKLGTFVVRVIPVSDYFVINDYRTIDKVEHRVFLLLDGRGETKKRLVKEPINPQRKKYFLLPIPHARSWKNQIFIAQPLKGFYIEVFDKYGEKLYCIKKEVKQIKSEKNIDDIGWMRYCLQLAEAVLNKPKTEEFLISL